MPSARGLLEKGVRSSDMVDMTRLLTLQPHHRYRSIITKSNTPAYTSYIQNDNFYVDRNVDLMDILFTFSCVFHFTKNIFGEILFLADIMDILSTA